MIIPLIVVSLFLVVDVCRRPWLNSVLGWIIFEWIMAGYGVINVMTLLWAFTCGKNNEIAGTRIGRTDRIQWMGYYAHFTAVFFTSALVRTILANNNDYDYNNYIFTSRLTAGDAPIYWSAHNFVVLFACFGLIKGAVNIGHISPANKNLMEQHSLLDSSGIDSSTP
jgi:hypothetical protein